MTLPFSSMQALEAVSHPNGLETRETANVLVCLFCAQTGDGDARELQTVFFQRFCQTTCFWDAVTLCRERGRCAAERRTRLVVRVSMGAAGGS